MKISTRGRYGLKALVALSAQSPKFLSIKNIAESQGISEGYLEQIISPLKKAGIVKSSRGASGGYALARPPTEITVGDALRVLEGSLAPVDCLHNNSVSCGVSDCGICATKKVFTRLFDKVNEVLDSVTLHDLAHDFPQESKASD